MIKDNQKYFNRLNVVVDAILIVVAYMISWFIKFESGIIIEEENTGALSLEVYLFALYFIVPGFLFLYYKFNLYSPKRSSGRKTEIFNIIKINTIGIVIILAVFFIIKEEDYSRAMFFLFYIFNIGLGILTRNLVRLFLRKIRKNGFNVKYILLVGYSRVAEEYIKRINLNPQWGYVIRGILDDNVPRGTLYQGVKVLGRIDNLFIILPESKLDEIAVTLSLNDYGRLEQIVTLCEKSGVHTKFIPDYTSVIPSNPYTEDIMGLPVINIRHVPLSNTLNLIAKRSVDIIGSLIGIIVTAPLMIMVGIAVRVTSKGPVIFGQERVGLHNKAFTMYKFRSMELQPKGKEQDGWTVKDDPRVTKIGKLIRRTSIDELPQLFNIFAGKMSLIGPRPERPQFVEKFKEEIPRYMIKHQVRPGLTGWAQVNGYRGDTSIRKRIDFDLYYIENWTMSLDIKIVFLTVFRGFVNKNAY